MTRVRTRRPSRRVTRQGIVVSAAGALAVAAALVWQSAYAGFTDSTPALSAGVGTGTVAVTNELEGIGAVTLPAMRPGIDYTECIIVTSTGSEPAQVRLYVRDKSGVTTLTSNITFTWTSGTGGGANADCAGFVSNGATVSSPLSSFPTSFDSGYLGWDTTGGTAPETRTYRVTFSLSPSAPASASIAWEAQQR